MNAPSHTLLSVLKRTTAMHHGRKTATATAATTPGRRHEHRPSGSESPAGKGPWRPPVRPAHRPADGHPRHHGREYRAAEPRERPSAHGLQHQLDDHQLLAHLRKPAPLRWPRRRSARASSDVLDRPRYLHRIVVRVGHGGLSGRPVRSPRGPGSWCSAALSRSACDHHDGVPGEPAGESARRLGSSRRRGRRDRRPRRRRPHRVRRLADDLLRQSAGRSGTRDRRTQDRARRYAEATLARARPPWSPARDNEPRRHRLRDHTG